MNDNDSAGTSAGSEGADLITLLLEQGHITAEQAEQARRRVRRASIPSHQAVIDLGFTSQEAVYRALGQSIGVPFVVLTEREIPPEVIQRVPAKVALHYKFVPIAFERTTLTAAFAAPPSMRDRENLRLLLGYRLEPVLATPAEISATLKSSYGLGAETVIQLRQDRGFQKRVESVIYDDTRGQDLDAEDAQSASIIHLVNQILLEALEMEATDIHVEPFQEAAKLRYRVDGMLRDVPTPPGMLELHDAIVSRLKIMANLNIAERRLPHDGRIRINVGEEEFDLRASIMPTRFGETICLRILNRRAIFLEMQQLGLVSTHFAIVSQLVLLPHGIVLVTGPTGSGKTTTLYAALAQVRTASPERKIITVEDPVEYEMVGISQIQIRSDIGLTFASALRSILRHDPDIILVGEIRDGETAEIAIRSALTGHLVLSTLHTNDSVGAVNRLVDMGIESYLVAASLVACVAQRLVRRICKHCKIEDENVTRRIRAEVGDCLGIAPEEVQAWRGRGCVECNHSGYRGRVGIFEIFLLDEEMQDLVSANTATSELRRRALTRGMRTLRENGWDKVAEGATSVEEVARITSTFQISYDMGDAE